MVTNNDPEYDLQTVIADLQDFFTNIDHRIYHSKGTPSQIGPESIYHIRHLQVLFEDRYVHKLTYDAIEKLDGTLLKLQESKINGGKIILVWRKNLRYVKRDVGDHLRLTEEYSSQPMNRATGQHAQLLTELGLSKLRLTLIDKDTRTYRGQTWTQTEHNLDYIMERQDVAYGIEVKNTFEYMPLHEFTVKLEMCRFLGLRPLFIVRIRHPNQWKLAKEADGLVYMFKTKIYPLGQEDLVARIWQHMRLPVQVWLDWPPSFYDTIGAYTA